LLEQLAKTRKEVRTKMPGLPSTKSGTTGRGIAGSKSGSHGTTGQTSGGSKPSGGSKGSSSKGSSKGK